MSKRSNKGKAYFYAKGQRDFVNKSPMSGELLRSNREKLKPFAFYAWQSGYYDSVSLL